MLRLRRPVSNKAKTTMTIRQLDLPPRIQANRLLRHAVKTIGATTDEMRAMFGSSSVQRIAIVEADQSRATIRFYTDESTFELTLLVSFDPEPEGEVTLLRFDE